MNDLISRKAAIESMREMYHAAEKWRQEAEDDTIKARAESCMASLVEMKLRLEKLPSAQQWVPVSERLPYMLDKIYFVTFAWGFVGVMEYKATGFHNYGSFTPVPIESIIAWMPLPESYEEAKE